MNTANTSLNRTAAAAAKSPLVVVQLRNALRSLSNKASYCSYSRIRASGKGKAVSSGDRPGYKEYSEIVQHIHLLGLENVPGDARGHSLQSHLSGVRTNRIACVFRNWVSVFDGLFLPIGIWTVIPARKELLLNSMGSKNLYGREQKRGFEDLTDVRSHQVHGHCTSPCGPPEAGGGRVQQDRTPWSWGRPFAQDRTRGGSLLGGLSVLRALSSSPSGRGCVFQGL